MPVATAMDASLGVVNPNLSSQIVAWQAARRANGEDPYDWAAFRRHMIAITAPDPGPAPTPQFSAGGAGFPVTGQPQMGAGTTIPGHATAWGAPTSGSVAAQAFMNDPGNKDIWDMFGPASMGNADTALRKWLAANPEPGSARRQRGDAILAQIGGGTPPPETDWEGYLETGTQYPTLPGGTPGTEQFRPEVYWWEQPAQWAQAGLEKAGLMAGPFGRFMQQQQQRPLGQWGLLTELAEAQQRPLPSLDLLNQLLSGTQQAGPGVFQQLWDLLKGGLPGSTGAGAAELAGRLAELGNRPEDVLGWYEATRPYLPAGGLSSIARSTIWNRYMQEVMNKPNMPFMQWLLGGR